MPDPRNRAVPAASAPHRGWRAVTAITIGVTFASLPGCRWFAPSPTPTPLRGPAPRAIAVSPNVGAAAPEAAERALAGLDEALAPRGYRLHSSPVVTQLLRDASIEPASASVADVARVTGADAVLVVDVTSFATTGHRPLHDASWELRWLLLSTNGTVIWHRESRGTWRRSDAFDDDPSAPLERRSEPKFQWIGGPSVPMFQDSIDVSSWLHRAAFEHLPRATR